MSDLLPALFAAPFVLAGLAITAWFVCCWATNADTSNAYDDPDNWGRH